MVTIHSIDLFIQRWENFGIFSAWTMVKRLSSLCVCVTRSIHNHNNATCVAQHNAQYTKLLVPQGCSTVYYAQNSSCAFVKLCQQSPFFIGKLWYENVYYTGNSGETTFYTSNVFLWLFQKVMVPLERTSIFLL